MTADLCGTTAFRPMACQLLSKGSPGIHQATWQHYMRWSCFPLKKKIALVSER